MEEIRTAVDSLIDLVKREKRISVDEAAKQLNLPVVIVHEWAGFLEEAKIIKIEYKLSTPYLRSVEETRSEESIKGSREDLQRERETLIIKSQATLKDIKAKDDYLVWLKKGFIDLPTTQKAQIAKPLVIILDQKNALEEWLAGLLIDLKRFNIAKGNAVEFAVQRKV